MHTQADVDVTQLDEGTRQIVYALQRQALALEHQADQLHRKRDYSAELPAADAEQLRAAIQRLAGAAGLQPQDAWPHGEIGLSLIEAQDMPTMAAVHTQAAVDVLTERHRQVTAEGWTPAHDDEHDSGELAAAGSAYAIAASDALHPHSQGDGDFTAGPPLSWPWDAEWWKPAEPRRMLVKASALLIAEIERLDRASGVQA
jgi:hypothetical protein